MFRRSRLVASYCPKEHPGYRFIPNFVPARRLPSPIYQDDLKLGHTASNPTKQSPSLGMIAARCVLLLKPGQAPPVTRQAASRENENARQSTLLNSNSTLSKGLQQLACCARSDMRAPCVSPRTSSSSTGWKAAGNTHCRRRAIYKCILPGRPPLDQGVVAARCVLLPTPFTGRGALRATAQC